MGIELIIIILLLPEGLALAGVLWVPVTSELVLQAGGEPFHHALHLSSVQLLPLLDEPLQEEHDRSDLLLHVSHVRLNKQVTSGNEKSTFRQATQPIYYF